MIEIVHKDNYIEIKCKKNDLSDRAKVVLLCKEIQKDFLENIKENAPMKPYLLLFEMDVYDKAIEYVKRVIDKKEERRYSQATIKNIQKQKDDFFRQILPLYNSSIWIRIAPLNDSKLQERIEKEFKAFSGLGLYSQASSQENFEFQLRLQDTNSLNATFSKAHSHFITPKLYPNELAFADQILSINTTSITHDEIEEFHEATFRILLIDDKGISEKQEEQNDKKQEEQNEKKQEKPKAEIIKELMSAEVLKPFADVKKKEFGDNNYNANDRLIWDTEHIEHYYFTTDEKRKKAIEKKAKENKENGKFFDIDRHISSSCNQIVQVTNLTDAIVLLADHRIRFDLIMMDYLLDKKDKDVGKEAINDGFISFYLLDKKDKDENDRELATNFFLWFQDKRCENTDVDYLREKLMKLKVMGCEALKDIICSQELNCLANEYVKADDTGKTGVLAKIEILSMSEKQSFNRELRELVKGNRGPLKKFWFFPITAFNSTFIDDLVYNHVRLIDYYWHISKGADPITTPYTFLSLLNKFFYLQLENSVFLQSEIIRFLRSTITRLQEVNNYNDFVAVMGNDYASFVQKFMSRPNFCRDQGTSLFSAYIWGNFYKNKDYEILHILVNYIHKFYHRCAFGTKDDYTKIVIFLRDMKMYIDEYFPDWNRRGDHYVDMARLSDIVDKCFGKQ